MKLRLQLVSLSVYSAICFGWCRFFHYGDGWRIWHEWDIPVRDGELFLIVLGYALIIAWALNDIFVKGKAK